jgi:RNA polymerase sigma-70 factor, ECF subfamily
MPSGDPLDRPTEAIRSIYAYVAYRIGPGPEAEDVVSETIERALRYRDSYTPSKGSPNAWLIGIARRCLFDASSARRNPASGVQAADEWVDDVAGLTVRRVDLQRALARLDEREQELIALRYGAGLTAREIGRIVQLRPNTVDVTLHRALARLRTFLADESHIGDEQGQGPA